MTATASFASAPISDKSSTKDQVSYSYGYIMGRNNAEVLKDVNLNAFIVGVQQGAAEQKPALKEEQMAKVLTQYKKRSDAQQIAAFQALATKNAQNGEAFLKANAAKPEVKTTKSGLQYQVLKAGQGARPKANSTVTVQYEGRLLDGTIFDSSIAREQSVDFQVSQVIAGWTEGLQLMQEGASYRFFIPAKLAYGEIGSGDAIEPNSTLIFDIELVKVKP